MRQLINLLTKELLQILRDPKILPILFVAPVVQLIILGYAATTDIKHLSLAVCDLSRTAQSRELIQRILADDTFVLAASVNRLDELDLYLLDGSANLAITIPRNFAGWDSGYTNVDIQILADGSNAMYGTLGIGHLRGAIAAATAGHAPLSLIMNPKVLFNPDLESRFFMVPGVFAMIIMVMTMILSSMAIVREIELGTMEQILVTPLSPGTLLAGKLIPYALVGAVEILVALPVVLLWFQVPLKGSLTCLALLTLPFMLCTLSLGFLVSTLARTQQQAMMIAAFVFMLPQIYLSGFIFPIQNMPQAFQIATFAVPLRYYVNVLRGVFLKGVGLEVLWPQGLAMVLIGIAVLTLARLRFRRQLD